MLRRDVGKQLEDAGWRVPGSGGASGDVHSQIPRTCRVAGALGHQEHERARRSSSGPCQAARLLTSGHEADRISLGLQPRLRRHQPPLPYRHCQLRRAGPRLHQGLLHDRRPGQN